MFSLGKSLIALKVTFVLKLCKELSNKEFALLEYLMRNANRVVSRAQIAQHVWDMTLDTTSNVIDVYVAALRKKLDRGYPDELIHTVRNTGYRFGSRE
mgnify:CR=1 FL=1